MTDRQRFRDRELDSLVVEGLASAGNADGISQSSYAQERASHCAAGPFSPWPKVSDSNDATTRGPFAHAAGALSIANCAIIASLESGGVDAGTVANAQTAVGNALDVLLTPYYKGRGKFESDRFLADLFEAKGGKITKPEVEFFGRLVGTWTGEKLANEIKEEVGAAIARGAPNTEIADIFIAGLKDAVAPHAV